MEITIDEAIKRYNSNAFYEKSDGNLQGYLEFRQLAKWLEQLQKIEQIVKAWNDMNSFDRCNDMNSYDSMTQISEVIGDGNDRV